MLVFLMLMAMLMNHLVNNDLLLGTRQKITPFGYQVVLIGNQLQLLRGKSVDSAEGTLDASVTQDDNVLWTALD